MYGSSLREYPQSERLSLQVNLIYCQAPCYHLRGDGGFFLSSLCRESYADLAIEHGTPEHDLEPEDKVGCLQRRSRLHRIKIGLFCSEHYY
jgi:hypothetical protein